MSNQGSNPAPPDPRSIEPGTVELQLDVESPQEPGVFHGGFLRDLDTDDLIQHVELELDDPRKSCGVGWELDDPRGQRLDDVDLGADDIGTQDPGTGIIGSSRLSDFTLLPSNFIAAGAIPTDPAASLRTSFRQVFLPEVFREAVRTINLTDDGEPWLTDRQLDDLRDQIFWQQSMGLLEANEVANGLLHKAQVDRNEATGDVDPVVRLVDRRGGLARLPRALSAGDRYERARS